MVVAAVATALSLHSLVCMLDAQCRAIGQVGPSVLGWPPPWSPRGPEKHSPVPPNCPWGGLCPSPCPSPSAWA